MKQFTLSTTMTEAAFLAQQQAVYLEKSILNKKADGEPFFFACLWHDAWAAQCNEETYSPRVTLDMDALRGELCAAFAQTGGRLEVRFLDLNLLSLVFFQCSEEQIRTFCQALEGQYHIKYTASFPEGPVGIGVFDTVHELTAGGSCAETVPISVGLSYQQNYLAGVVSRDRQEDKDLLLIEAVDQALLTYHGILDAEL